MSLLNNFFPNPRDHRKKVTLKRLEFTNDFTLYDRNNGQVLDYYKNFQWLPRVYLKSPTISKKKVWKQPSYAMLLSSGKDHITPLLQIHLKSCFFQEANHEPPRPWQWKRQGWSAPESTQLMLIKITSNKKTRHSLNGVIYI